MLSVGEATLKAKLPITSHWKKFNDSKATIGGNLIKQSKAT